MEQVLNFVVSYSKDDDCYPRHHRCLSLLEFECDLETKITDNKSRWKGDLLKLCPEAAVEKFLTKGGALQKLFWKVTVVHLCSALLACFLRF